MIARKLAALAAFEWNCLRPSSGRDRDWQWHFGCRLHRPRELYAVKQRQVYGTSGSGDFGASDVIVAQDRVLTAAHVTSGASSLQFYRDSAGTMNIDDILRTAKGKI
ncbi:MAG: hypothetical protein ABIP67_07345 [Burkholderiales bacterium]